MAAHQKGQPEANKKPDISFVPNVGMRQTLRKDFMSYDSAKAFAASMFAQGYRADVKQKGDDPVWTVECSIEGDPTDPQSDLQNTHELSIVTLNPDIKTNLHLQSLFSANAVAAIAAIEKIANDRKDGTISSYEDAIQALADSNDISDADINSGLASDLFDQILLGVETYLAWGYAYKHQFNFGTAADVAAAHVGFGHIWTPEQVADEEDTPAIIGLADIGGEWLKLPTERTSMFGGRETLSYQYTWAEEWSRLLYPVYS